MIYRFGEFRLDRECYQLHRGAEPVHIEPLGLELLVFLIENRDRLVPREELLQALWGGRFVSDAVLARCIHQVRLSLGDDSERQRFIMTIRGRGYRFSADVETVRAGAVREPPEDRSTRSQKWRRRHARGPALLTLLSMIAVAAILMIEGPSQPTDTAALPEPSIAVLPFADLSADRSQAHLGDGLAEELIGALSHIEGLRVVARTSSFAFRDTGERAESIGRQLAVATLLEGSVQKLGDRLRVSVKLVRTSDGTSLWSKRYERGVGNIFELEDHITRQVLRSLGPDLIPDASKSFVRATTSNAEAYELLFLARRHQQRVTKPDLERGIELLREAIELDPGFAQAHASMSEQLTVLAGLSGPARQALLSQARFSALRAIDADPSYAGGHAALGFVRLHGDWDRAAAVESCSRALELDPGSSVSRYRMGVVLSAFPRPEEALAQLRRAVALDPFLSTAQSYLGLMLRVAGRPQEAIAQLQATLARHPDLVPARVFLSDTYRLLGMEEEAIAEQLEVYRRVAEASPPLPDLAVLAEELEVIAGGAGAEAFWRRQLDSQIDAYYRSGGVAGVSFWRGLGDPMRIAENYAFLGEWDQAIRWFDRSVAEHHPQVVYLETMATERWPALLSNPGFREVLRWAGLLAE